MFYSNLYKKIFYISDPVYPRSPHFTYLRSLFNIWRFCIIFYITTVISNIISAGSTAFTDFSTLQKAIIGFNFFFDSSINPIIRIVLAFVFLVLLYAGLWAKADKEREEKQKQSLSFHKHIESQSSLNPAFSLPPLDEEVIGREKERELIAQRLKRPRTLTFLYGVPGIGKSLLTKEAMHRIAKESSLVLWISSEKFLNGNDILYFLIKSMASDEETDKLLAHSNFNEMRTTFCSLLKGKQAYVALDNVDNLSAEDITRLCGALHDAGVSAILTDIRKPPTSIKGLPKEGIIEVLPLTLEKALDLFAHVYSKGKAGSLTDEERFSATNIIQALEYNTLLIKQIGAYAGQADRSLKELALEILQDTHNESKPIKILNAWYIKNLSRVQQDSERLIPYIGAFASRSFLRSAVIQVAKHMDIHKSEEYFDSYAQLLLLEREEEKSVERFRVHLIIYRFAREHFMKDLTDEEHIKVYRFLGLYYTRWARNIRYPYNEIQPEESNIIEVLKQIHMLGDDALTAELCHSMCFYWRQQHSAQQAEEYLSLGIRSARELLLKEEENSSEIRRKLIEMLSAYGHALRLVNLRKTIEAYREVIQLQKYVEASYLDKARAYYDLAEALMNNDLDIENKVEVEELFNKAVENFRQASDIQGELYALSSIGELRLIRGFPQQAIPVYLESLKKWRALRSDKTIDRDAIDNGLLINLTSLSEAERRLRHYRHAQRYAKESIRIAMACKNIVGLGISYSLLGQVHFKLGNLQTALTYYKQGIEYSKMAGSSLDEARTLSYIGEISTAKAERYARKKRFVEAEESLRQAKDQFNGALKLRTGQDYKGEASDYQGLARVAHIQFRCSNDDQRSLYLQEALSYLQKSLKILDGKEADFLRGQDLFLQAQVEIELGNLEDAKKHLRESCSLYEFQSSEYYQQAKATLLALSQHANMRSK